MEMEEEMLIEEEEMAEEDEVWEGAAEDVGDGGC